MTLRRFCPALLLALLPTLTAFTADDPYGDPLPEGAKLRLGTARMRVSNTTNPTVLSPDGKHLYFTAVPDKDEAWNTNYDICRVPTALPPPSGKGEGATKWECLTSKNAAAPATSSRLETASSLPAGRFAGSSTR